MTTPISAQAARAALKETDPLVSSLKVYSTESDGLSPELTVGERRRRLRAGEPDPVSTVALVVNDDGVLLWREGGMIAGGEARRRFRGATRAPEGELVELYQYEKLEPNEINAFLTTLDEKLNDQSGLRALKVKGPGASATLAPLQGPVQGKKRRLLLIHGTFSKSEALLDGITRAPSGATFLRRIGAYYDEILAFDHPTLSVGPMLNAFDLRQLTAGTSGPLDIVAHSRGGLVTRWFFEGFGGGGEHPRRGVLVGSPLGGTSLAAPPRLRDALSLLSNFGTVLKLGGAAATVYLPLLAGPLALLRIATSIATIGAKTPIIDAAVSMIPGLAAQSRVAGNHELDRVQDFVAAAAPKYFVVQSNFESQSASWKFWRWFRGDRLQDVAADKVFPGPNDLVVDTSSMSEFRAANHAPLPKVTPAKQCDFGTSSVVHHTNYFEQDKTLDFILDQLKVP